MTRLNIFGLPNDRPYAVDGPCISRTFNAAAVGAGAGTFFAAVQLAWYPDPVVSATRFGKNPTKSDAKAIGRAVARPAFWMSSAAAAFAATECLAESVRETKDPFNAAIGGLAGGAVCGAISGRGGIMVSTALGMGVFMFLLDASGPDTVWDQESLKHKMFGVLPDTHIESKALGDLKDKYPKFKDI
mmetsp:Transcript_10898/g.15874  ORF Transcript_10898/g.15874 Transcript_10898/m.15874 type:complete len:187 (-) Transcript_10898:232-792(-)